MEVPIRPLQDRILAKRVESETRSAGGIIIPDNAQEKPKQAEIVAVGPGRRMSDGKIATRMLRPVIWFTLINILELK